MKKLVVALTIALALGGCASTEPKFTADKDVAFKPDLENHSIAYNIAMNAGAPDILRDVNVPEKAWNPTTTGSHLVSGGLGAMVGGLGFGMSELFRSLTGNAANGFDKPLLTMWIEVDSLKDYGSDEFEEMIYKKAHKAFFDAYIGDDEVLKVISSQNKSVGKYYKGDNCDNYWKKSIVPKEVIAKQDSCYLYSNVNIIRPQKKGQWLPDFLQMNNDKEYVLVNISLPRETSSTSPYLFSNGITFTPPQWSFGIKIDGSFKYYPINKGYPSYKYKDTVYIFVTPEKDGNQRGTITLDVNDNK
ncbi:MAG: hypothetical protein QM500_12745 [Methylococcales bacterium]